jgi:hypothetical protein
MLVPIPVPILVGYNNLVNFCIHFDTLFDPRQQLAQQQHYKVGRKFFAVDISVSLLKCSSSHANIFQSSSCNTSKLYLTVYKKMIKVGKIPDCYVGY